jgi:hypothetical protein
MNRANAAAHTDKVRVYHMCDPCHLESRVNYSCASDLTAATYGECDVPDAKQSIHLQQIHTYCGPFRPHRCGHIQMVIICAIYGFLASKQSSGFVCVVAVIVCDYCGVVSIARCVVVAICTF